jgi:hypothetical protein
VSPGKHDAIRRGDFKHFTHDFYRVRVTNADLAARESSPWASSRD